MHRKKSTGAQSLEGCQPLLETPALCLRAEALLCFALEQRVLLLPSVAGNRSYNEPILQTNLCNEDLLIGTEGTLLLSRNVFPAALRHQGMCGDKFCSLLETQTCMSSAVQHCSHPFYHSFILWVQNTFSHQGNPLSAPSGATREAV